MFATCSRSSLARILLAASCALSTPALAAAADLEGSWSGVLGGKLHLVLVLTKRADGSTSGVLDSVDERSCIPVDAVSSTSNQVKLEFKRVGGTFAGTLEGNNQMKGTWTQDGFAQPLTFVKDAKLQEACSARPPPAKPYLDLPVDMAVPTPPTTFRSGGRSHLAYEVHLTNFGRQEMLVSEFAVLDNKTGEVLLRSAEEDLAGRSFQPGQLGASGARALRLGPGQCGVIFLWLTIDGGAPTAVRHRLSAKLGDAAGPMSVEGAVTEVRSSLAPIAAPLRGENWVAINGPSNASHHRRALIPIRGHAAIGQRFAIDWVRVDPDGKTFKGDPADNRSYYAYGSEALAVADGTIVAVKDGLPENRPELESRAVPVTLETVAGNHVVVDLGADRFATYAHLQPGSLRVKVGDRVKVGQVLGLVGNTGNSSEPHLHFQLADGPSVLGSEGVPYALRNFRAGRDPKEPRWEERRDELPGEDELVSFE